MQRLVVVPLLYFIFLNKDIFSLYSRVSLYSNPTVPLSTCKILCALLDILCLNLLICKMGIK